MSEPCQLSPEHQTAMHDLVADLNSWLGHQPQTRVVGCRRCGGDRMIRCADPECYTCAIDLYCTNAEPCSCTKKGAA